MNEQWLHETVSKIQDQQTQILANTARIEERITALLRQHDAVEADLRSHKATHNSDILELKERMDADKRTFTAKYDELHTQQVDMHARLRLVGWFVGVCIVAIIGAFAKILF